jgi:cyclic lactone autoinducer peptide
MKSKMIIGTLEKKFIKALVVVCTMMAATISVSACMWGLYQPEEPECLRK